MQAEVSTGLSHRRKGRKPIHEQTKRFERAVALHRSGQLRRASRLYDAILRDVPENDLVHHLRARIDYRTGKFESAVSHLRQALLVNPARAAAWSDLGNVYRKLGQQEEALTAYEKCLAIEPANVGALNNCAGVLRALGRPDEAIARYNRALTLAPRNTDILINLGNVYRDAGRFRDAEMTYRRAVAAEPANLKALLSLGLILLARRQIPDARHYLEKALSIDPAHVEALRALSAVLELGGQFEDAVALAGRATRNRPPVIISSAKEPLGRVLLLSCVENRCFRMNENWEISAPADNNLKEFVDRAMFDVIELYVEHFEHDPSVLNRLPAPTVILNTIAEADDKRHSLMLASEIIERLNVPAINRPSCVLAATRDRNSVALSDIPGIVFPRTERIRPDGRSARGIWPGLAADGFAFPVILREPGSHLGTTMGLVRSLSEMGAFLSANAAEEIYVIQYHECPRPHGFYRRFRFFFLDGSPYAANCYFGKGWNVHRSDSDALMTDQPVLKELEQAFLRMPEEIIGAENLRLLQRLPAFLQLEYFGVDFNVTQDGALLIYEANAAMANRRDRAIDLPYLTPHFDAFAEGVRAMLLNRCSGAGLTCTN